MGELMNMEIVDSIIFQITMAAYLIMFVFTRFSDTPQDDGWKGKLYKICEAITLISPKSKQVNKLLDNLDKTKSR